MLNSMTEKELIEKFLYLSKERDNLKLALKKINKDFFQIANYLNEILTAENKTATATFEGLGYVMLSKPQVSASCPAEKKEDFFRFLKNINREDLIKTDVSAQTLKAFVREILNNPETGIQLPDYLSLYFFPDVRLYNERGKLVAGCSLKNSTKE